MLAEARKHRAWRLVKSCPGLAEIRTAQLLPIVVTPYRFKDKRSLLPQGSCRVLLFATRGICADILRATLAEHRLLIGEAVLAELGPALVGELRVPPDLAEETEGFLRREAEVIDRPSPLEIHLRDPDDGAILEEAVGGQADVLVTGDKDLMEGAQHAPIRIVSLPGFWDPLRSDAAEGS